VYLTVKQGDHLPSVALAQARLVESGAQDLVVDGIFGPKTAAAVKAFQTREKLPITGRVDQQTWGGLIKKEPITVVDVLDASEIDVLQDDGPFLRDGHSHFIVNYGMSSGAYHVMQKLIASEAPRSVALLRFHGHGYTGTMHVTGGWLTKSSAFKAEHFKSRVAIDCYHEMGAIMKPYGSIELHGCFTGRGMRGHKLLAGMAQACGVPVSAGLGSQTGGDTANRLEGATLTQCPSGLTLRAWAKKVFSVCQW
jgi:hypothetical protein